MTPPHHWWHQWPEWTNLRTQLNNPAQSKAKVHYKALVRWTKAPFQQNHATHFKFLPCNFTTLCIRVSHNITLCIVIEVSNPSEQHFKSFLGPRLTTRTRQQCRLNWPTLVLAVLQLFREEFGWIRKMPRVQNKQKSAKGWELVPVTNLNFRLHLLCFEKKSTPKLPLIRILHRKTSHTKKGLERFLQK